MATPTVDVAALVQERAAAEQAVPESISPVHYDDNGVLVPRVFKDQTAALAKNAGARVSRFSTTHLNDLEAALAGLSRQAGGAYGFYYDARRDTVIVEGNLDVNLLPAEALANGEITFTYTADGDPQSRTEGSASH